MTEPHAPYPEIGSKVFMLDGDPPIYRVLRLVWSAPVGSKPTTPARPWYKPETQPFPEAGKQ